MKKTLAAVAVLGAFAGSALAADVQLYGIVDTGLRYLNSDLDTVWQEGKAVGVDATDKFSMESGMASGSRWGIKGTEDLGNGLTVGFILEDGFTSDDGAEKGVMFDRESSLFIQGGFGKLAMGRIGSLNSGNSSWSMHGMMSAFGTSWGSYSANADNIFGNSQVWDNMIAYQTPSFAGFTVFAQYAMGSNNDENESRSDRYYAIGATYANGPLNLYLAVDSTNYKTADANGALPDANHIDDSLTVQFGGNFDFEVAKVFAGVSYFDNARLSNYGGVVGDWAGASYDSIKDSKPVYWTAKDAYIEGWSISASTSVPVAGGNALFGVGYLSAELTENTTGNIYDADVELDRWVVSAGYDYPFSKRTDVYGVVTYNQDSIDSKVGSADPSVFGVMLGLRHRF